MKNRMQSQSLSRIGELALLRRICRTLPLREDVIIGAGDDCAVVRGAQPDKFDYLLKSDSVVEGIHFTPLTPGELIGNKALGRVLSDIAAMGGEPLWILIDLVAPSKTPVRRIEKIYAGMIKLARQFNAAIVGGDVSAGHDLQLHVFGVGRVKKGAAILRSGAKAGEAIFVTGSLGGSLAGKHLRFQPRLREGQWLAKGGWATSMIDISDGLLRDLGHITKASKVGAQLMLDAIPISAIARQCSDRKTSPVGPALPPATLCARPQHFAQRCGQVALRAGAHGRLAGTSASRDGAPQAAALQNHFTTELLRKVKGLKHALNDGEDYELLFTVPKRKINAFVKAWQHAFKLSCVQIGWTTPRKGSLEGIDPEGKVMKLTTDGFEHFR